jgi:hypothetical protein
MPRYELPASKWTNPFRLRRNAISEKRAGVIAAYERWLRQQRHLMGALHELAGGYLAASGGGSLPAMARQIYYQARPKIMAMTDDKELASPTSPLRCRRHRQCRLQCCPWISQTSDGSTSSVMMIEVFPRSADWMRAEAKCSAKITG